MDLTRTLHTGESAGAQIKSCLFLGFRQKYPVILVFTILTDLRCLHVLRAVCIFREVCVLGVKFDCLEMLHYALVL